VEGSFHAGAWSSFPRGASHSQALMAVPGPGCGARPGSVLALSLAACLLPAGLRAFTPGTAERGFRRCPTLRAPARVGAAAAGTGQAWGCSGGAEEQPRCLLSSALTPAALLAAATAATVAAGRGRRTAGAGARHGLVMARAAKADAGNKLADRLEAKLQDLREREAMLIQRIEAVQTTIDEIDEDAPEAEGETAPKEEAKAEEKKAEEPVAAKELEAQELQKEEGKEEKTEEKKEEKKEEAAKETAAPAPASAAEPESQTFEELRILEQLADVHEDVTKDEIRFLEELAGGKKTGLFKMREAGKRLRERIESEFKAMRQREKALLTNIDNTKQKISELEQESAQPVESKALQELKMLESLANAYKDTTSEEIKALEKFAKEDDS